MFCFFMLGGNRILIFLIMSVRLRLSSICTRCSRWGSIGGGFVNKNGGSLNGWVCSVRWIVVNVYAISDGNQFKDVDDFVGIAIIIF